MWFPSLILLLVCCVHAQVYVYIGDGTYPSVIDEFTYKAGLGLVYAGGKDYEPCVAGTYSSKNTTTCVTPAEDKGLSPNVVSIGQGNNFDNLIKCPSGMVSDETRSNCVVVPAGQARLLTNESDGSVVNCTGGNREFSPSGSDVCLKIPSGLCPNVSDSNALVTPDDLKPCTWTNITDYAARYKIQNTEKKGIDNVTLTVVVILCIFIVAIIVAVLYLLYQMFFKKPREYEQLSAVAPVSRLRHSRHVNPDALADPAYFEEQLELVCREADVDVNTVREMVSLAAKQALASWSYDVIPRELAAHCYKILYKTGNHTELVMNVAQAAMELMNDGDDSERLMEDLKQCPYYSLCNPLNYRGAGWPLPNYRSLLEKILCVQDDGTGIEDASMTVLRHLYMQTIEEGSRHIIGVLASDDPELICSDESLRDAFTQFKESSLVNVVTEIQLDTGKQLQVVGESGKLQRIISNAPVYLFSAVKLSQEAADRPIGNVLQAIRLAIGAAIASTIKTPQHTSYLESMITQLDAAIQEAGLTEMELYGAGIVMRYPQAAFSVILDHVSSLVRDTIVDLIGEEATVGLFSALQRLVFPAMVLGATVGRETLQVTPQGAMIIRDLPILFQGSLEACSNMVRLPHKYTGAAEGAPQTIQDLISRPQAGASVLIMPLIRWGPRGNETIINTTVYYHSKDEQSQE